MKKYDAIIIGAGQAGVPLAKKLAQAGWKTAIIEKRWVGGSCVNDGCTPTKTIIASARVAHLVRTSAQWGVHVDNFSIDMPFIKGRKDEIVESSRGKIHEALQETDGLDLIMGEATFTEHKSLWVKRANGDQETITADTIFINTGTQTVIPDIPGLTEIPYLTSTTVLDLEKAPAHLVIIGGSYIALEFGQFFRRMGSEVTILEKEERFFPHEDEDVATELRSALEAEGISIRTQIEIEQLASAPQGHIKVRLSSNGSAEEIVGSHVLVATGREPQTARLQLDKTGINTNEKGYIPVNEQLETNVPGIYALGDVNGGPAFTHIAYNDYIIVSKNLLEKGHLSTKERLVPYCVFTDPQLGRVGLTEDEARAQGYTIQVAKIPMTKVARAYENGETRGLMKAIVDTHTKKILGASILGTEGGEIVSVLQVAMMGGLTYDQIRFGIFAHPTFSESLNNLFASIKD